MARILVMTSERCSWGISEKCALSLAKGGTVVIIWNVIM